MRVVLALCLLTGLLLISRAQQDDLRCPFESDTAECTLITVADGIQVAVAVFRAFETAEDEPLVMIAGNPGGSTLAQFGTIMDAEEFSQPFRQKHDIILIDLRGTYYSQPSLHCPAVLEAERDALSDPDNRTQLIETALRACYEQLVSDGIDPGEFNSLANVQDVLTVVDVLGYDDFHYYGVSYGALLGFHLLQQHAERLASVTLDSVITPDADYISGAWQNYLTTREMFFAACLDDAVCAHAYPNLIEDFTALTHDLKQSPQRITIAELDLKIDDTFINVYFQQSLYFTELLPDLPFLITLMADGQPLWITEFAEDIFLEPIFSSGVFYSTICAEELPHEPLLQLPPDDVIEESFIGGCSVWQVPPLPDFTNLPVPAEVPTLMFAGEFDPIAPSYYMDEASEWHKNDYSYTVPATGHGVIIRPCVRQMMGDFLADPSAEPDATCLEDIRLEFFVEED